MARNDARRFKECPALDLIEDGLDAVGGIFAVAAESPVKAALASHVFGPCLSR
jgi:hypothetical protein